MRQKDGKFKTSLGYIAKPCQKQKNKKQNNNNKKDDCLS
jgi:hypothetical protein